MKGGKVFIYKVIYILTDVAVATIIIDNRDDISNLSAYSSGRLRLHLGGFDRPVRSQDFSPNKFATQVLTTNQIDGALEG
ncbi:MAG: hypothetical protein HC941_14280 [Microcoleus sp. SU_5_3]|nr:hypothetical protein [Microcoleus sp. SU_5_3]